MIWVSLVDTSDIQVKGRMSGALTPGQDRFDHWQLGYKKDNQTDLAGVLV